MTQETGALSQPANQPAATAPAVPVPAAKPKPKFDQRFIAPIFITLVLAGAHLTMGALESPWKTGLAIVCSIIAEIVLGRIYTGKTPHLASAYISGISVGILVRSPFFWPYAICAIISIASKYVLRVDNRHIWNPSNFGIAAMLFLAPQVVASLSIQWGNSIGAMLVIWILGSVIISRLKRFHICATYVVSFLVLAGVRSMITGHSYWAEVAPITGPMYQLFTFFMITDPKTTVSSKKGQIAVVVLVAVAECLFRLNQNVHAPYYALFFVGPAANMVEIWMQRRRRAAQPAIA
jgi:Na+-transporting NADH:ubiquinone oxidoreductase subunit NqrB